MESALAFRHRSEMGALCQQDGDWSRVKSQFSVSVGRNKVRKLNEAGVAVSSHSWQGNKQTAFSVGKACRR
ncbi:hypothetical protein [Algoriphagus sp. NG3]|uniref:hypothetical protein n=1 Tax=Algoriphagus sp. NG3 TaxID=3097546 RepID=UPI002A808E5E|nr:hypothetical protein [Algoriphagus sp. NG3]WPR73727.1 hypothetical protein SLW71_13670 [Algoriphagus sp. NG3]